MLRKTLVIGLVFFTFFACRKEALIISVDYYGLGEVPPGFPAIEFPEGNEYSYERWTLGKRLFFDPILSVDSTISCASCHQPALAFSDDRAFSLGVGEQEGRRNAPSLANVAFHPYFTREGGVPTLEMQVLVPIQEHDEFNHNIVLIAEKLKEIPDYAQHAIRAYDREMDAFVITRALSNFERTLVSGQSPYDQENTYGHAGVMSTAARRGQALFFSEKTQCSTCHGGFNFTDYRFANNGLYQTYADAGRARLTQKAEDEALFKVPSLRNVAVTGPYMHDGSISSLSAVIDHYNSGGRPHKNKSTLIQPLGLTEAEKSDLLAFLHALTDEIFINNKRFSDE